MSQKIDTHDEVLKLIQAEIKALRHELNKYPYLRELINVDDIERSIRIHFLDQAIKDDPSLKRPFVILKNAKKHNESIDDIIESFTTNNPNNFSDRRREMLKFKAYYLKWAKNLIAELNKAKLINKWHWLEVKPIAQAIADLKLTNDKNESFFIFSEDSKLEFFES